MLVKASHITCASHYPKGILLDSSCLKKKEKILNPIEVRISLINICFQSTIVKDQGFKIFLRSLGVLLKRKYRSFDIKLS